MCVVNQALVSVLDVTVYKSLVLLQLSLYSHAAKEILNVIPSAKTSLVNTVLTYDRASGFTGYYSDRSSIIRSGASTGYHSSINRSSASSGYYSDRSSVIRSGASAGYTGYDSGIVYFSRIDDQPDLPLHKLDHDPSRKLRALPQSKIADKISKLILSVPDSRGLAIMISWNYSEFSELIDMSEFFALTCRFALFNPPADPTQSLSVYTKLSLLSSLMEGVRLVELNDESPLVVVARDDGYMFTYYGLMNFKDIIMPLFSHVTSHLTSNPKIFLFLTCFSFQTALSSSLQKFSDNILQAIFPTIGGNFIVGCIRYSDAIPTTTILRALKTPQQSVQEIFELLRNEMSLVPGTDMIVIDHLNEPVYLHSDAPQGTHSEPGKPHPTHNTFHTPPCRTHQEAAAGGSDLKSIT